MTAGPFRPNDFNGWMDAPPEANVTGIASEIANARMSKLTAELERLREAQDAWLASRDGEQTTDIERDNTIHRVLAQWEKLKRGEG